METPDPFMAELRLRRREMSRLAEELGISRQAVSDWKRVPPLRVLEVSRITGLKPTFLRPDIYPEPAKKPRPRRRRNGRKR